jgi:hypothetical protein
MKTSTHIIRLGGTLALAAVVAGATVPAALAGHDGRSPDTHDAALAAQVTNYGPLDGWYGYAVSLTKSSRNAVLDGRSPDTHDAALAAQVTNDGYRDGWYGYAVSLTKSSRNAAALDAQVAKYGPLDGWYGYAVSLTKSSRNAVLDGRSPDTVDAALLAHTQVIKVVSSSSFAWGDFGVGAGTGIGLILLCGGGLGLAYQRRHRPQSA